MIHQTDASKRGRASRNKGANAERELVGILQERGLDVRRGYVSLKESDIVGLRNIHPEVKRVEKLNIEKAMEQAIIEAVKRGDGVPTVFHRRDRGEWLVTMRLDEWVDLYRGEL